MSPSPQLAPPGSSSYDSDTMHVGDGTWDAGRDDFLLPNLVGFNFATMRYNGMGNRFFTMSGYHSLVEAHGIIAAVTFLGAVPLAIFLVRFYGRQPRMALRLHIWLQILTLLLSTVVIILGFMAVGPNRGLTNPHHGIGVAIYVLVWVQVIGGYLLHRKEKGRTRHYIPVRAMLHHWLGRAIALLGITQVALGLTVYGSPLYLFVLYTLYVFALLVLYFILEWLAERRRAQYDNGGSYYSDEVVSRPAQRQHSGLGKLAVAGAAGAGLAALFRRRSSRHRAHPSDTGTEDSTTSYYTDEKASDHHHKGIGHRLLQVAAIGGAVAAAKKLFGRGQRDDDSEAGPYRPPRPALGGNQSVTTDSMSRVEEGRPPIRPTTPVGASPGYIRPTHPLAQPPMTPGSGRRHSGSSLSYTDSYASASPSRQDRRPHTFRDALAAGGAVFAVRQLFKRKQRKDQGRVEQEKISRMNGTHGFTGDGVTPPRRTRHHRMGSQSASDLTSDLESRPGASGALPVAGVGAAAASALADRNRIRPVGTDPVIHTPGPPGVGPADIPPLPPPHLDSSGSELYTTASGRQRHRHHLRDEAAAGLAGAALGAAAGDHSRRRHSGRNTESMESPPVSLNVKMHGDGRHVTLRRLTEEEAAAQREARRKQRASSAARRHRNSSLSSSEGDGLVAGPSADRRWRRTEAMEAEQAAQNEAAAAPRPVAPVVPSTGLLYPTPPPPGTQGVDPRTGQPYHVPPPPPIPGSTSNLGPGGSAITSPGTETSGATEYANNRRRRRAERAQARLAREGKTGNTVDFT
ncbi:hypothetical protein PV05_03395 [Exophiala xenobiotica]|uniref:Cytochrome b561 domain-containing protein n=1 Tax=Exophiala xenobiotica TaxID=348802 RepID=A0A0D2D9C4_9EURO|nr:uncharacterized protein PV05_03395 [Exophiala xenobiotica]KIW58902.1 hypothetical protein PV05_03395 [Exophiala xenobiotica]